MALGIYTLIITTYFFNKNGFSCVCLFFLSSLTPFPFLLFSSTFLLPSPLPVFFFFYFTTVICWHFPAINYFYIYLPINIIKIQRNLHLNYFYYKDTSPFRVTARKNDLFLSIHWFSVEQKGHAFHSSVRSSLWRHLPWNEGLLPCSGRAQW